MRRECRKLLALTLAIAYLGIVSFGHFFHNHGLVGHGGCGCVAASHHHQDESCSCQGLSHSGLLARDSDSDDAHASHGCPICQFYSHHGVWVGADDAPTVAPLFPSVVQQHSASPVEVFLGPQQPRAPPLSA